MKRYDMISGGEILPLDTYETETTFEWFRTVFLGDGFHSLFSEANWAWTPWTIFSGIGPIRVCTRWDPWSGYFVRLPEFTFLLKFRNFWGSFCLLRKCSDIRDHKPWSGPPSIDDSLADVAFANRWSSDLLVTVYGGPACPNHYRISPTSHRRILYPFPWRMTRLQCSSCASYRYHRCNMNSEGFRRRRRRRPGLHRPTRPATDRLHHRRCTKVPPNDWWTILVTWLVAGCCGPCRARSACPKRLLHPPFFCVQFKIQIV